MRFTTNSNRIFGLDIFRAAAIVLVVMGHGAFMLNNTAIEAFPYFKMIDGVDIFFVLSGFLIGGILLKELHRSDQFKIKDLLKFWKRRWFRTLPNYYLILLLNYLFIKYELSPGDLDQFNFHFLTFTQNFKTPFYGFFWESWSLSIEEWFYLTTPVLMFALSKLLSKKYAFLSAAVVMIVFPLIYRIMNYEPNMDQFWWDVTYRKTILCRLDSIGYGLLFAWVYYFYGSFWKKIRIPSFIFGAGLIYFVIHYHQGPNSFYKQTIYFSLVPLGAILLLPLFEAYKQAKGIVAIAIEHISKISYSMYLINLALVASVIGGNFPPDGGTDGIMKYLIYWGIVIGGSTLLYYFFEKPMMDLRDRKILPGIKKE